MRVNFGTRRMRRITIEHGGGFAIKSITTSPIDTVSAVALAPITFAVEGDSNIGSGGIDGIAPTCARMLGTAIVVNGSAGTGWLNDQAGGAGKQVYAGSVRLPAILANNPTILVWFGGVNDGTTGLQAAVESWIDAVHAGSPKTIPVICGPEAPPSTTVGTKSALLRAAAAAKGTRYIGHEHRQRLRAERRPRPLGNAVNYRDRVEDRSDRRRQRRHLHRLGPPARQVSDHARRLPVRADLPRHPSRHRAASADRRRSLMAGSPFPFSPLRRSMRLLA